MVGVSIVSYNTRKLLKDTLSTLEKSKQKLEIFVVDNNSSDGSAEMVEKEFKGVHLYKSETNLGFAKGQNINLKQIKAEYSLILNPDTSFDDSVIEKMVEFMESYKNCGIASCKIIGFDDLLHSNGGDFPFGSALFSWLLNFESFGVKKNFHRQDKSYFEKPHSVDWVGGTFMMVQKQVFEKIGYLDERYFMYFEDAEFCYRAKKAGFDVMINPDVVIKHKSGASSKNPRFSQWVGEFKGLIMFYKNQFGFFNGLVLKLLIYLSILLRMTVFGILGKKEIAQTYGKVIVSI